MPRVLYIINKLKKVKNYLCFLSSAPEIPGVVIPTGSKITFISSSVNTLSLKISSLIGLPVTYASLASFAAVS